jgi:hypothetical protein
MNVSNSNSKSSNFVVVVVMYMLMLAFGVGMLLGGWENIHEDMAALLAMMIMIRLMTTKRQLQ